LSFGLAVMTMVYTVGHISGAHFNPAVTIAFALTRHFPKSEIVPYVVAQILGATTASLIHLFTLSGLTKNTLLNLGVTQPLDGNIMTAFSWEFILTFFLMLVIMAVATDYRAVSQNAGWAIGAMIWLEATFAGPISNASMNPARSIGPALVAGTLDNLYIYIGATILGATAGAYVYNYIRCENSKDQIKGCC
ncbi:MAG: aquaporin, partial [Calditrichaeota bacterium]|nr:aquaporin [Calditrichota bacterium]